MKLKHKLLLSASALFIVVSAFAFDQTEHFQTQDIDGGGSGYSCTVTSTCGSWGSVSCTGTEKCKRGHMWVECDGKRTDC